MTDNAAAFKARMLAAVAKGLAAGQLDTSKTKKSGLGGYGVDAATENSVRSARTPNITSTNEIGGITSLHPISVNTKSQPGEICVQCGAGGDLWHLDTRAGPVLVHEQCASRLPRAEAAEPSTAYQKVTPECSVTVIELPQAARYRKVFATLQTKPPALIEVERWRQCVEDGKRFLAKWGEQAEALGWSSADLLGLQTPPAKPHSSYNRLSRYDATGLCWLLQGKHVIALTADTATIRNPTSGTIIVYRRHRKPALGSVGDSLDDLK